MDDLLDDLSQVEWQTMALGGVALFALGLNLYCACRDRATPSSPPTSPSSASSSLTAAASAAAVEMVEIRVDSASVATQTDPESEEEEVESIEDLRRKIKQQARRFSV